MYKEVRKWLRLQSMPVAESHLRLRLESHPDYPSLVAVKDTLEELGIESNACQGTKEQLKNESKPFLAHFNIGEGHVLFFKDVATAEQKAKDFDKHWSGHVMFAEPTNIYGNAEHNKRHKKEKRNNAFAIATIILFVGILLGLSIASRYGPAVLLTVSNFIGLYFSWLIAQKEFGISNSITDKICSMSKHSRCESVLFSKGAKLFNWLTWGDVGIVYFASSLLFLGIAVSALGSKDAALQVYYLISLIGLAFPLYSLYYQWKVVKQWCMLCIGVLAILVINAIISASNLSNHLSGDNFVYLFAPYALLSITSLFVWQLLKSGYQKSLSSSANEIKATRLKRNPDIFNALLLQQEVNPINLPNADEPIRFGNVAAPYQLVIACNPYCDPCARAHHAIEQLYEKYPDAITVSIRFGLFNLDESSSVTQAVTSILKAVSQKEDSTYEILKEWYGKMDYKIFQNKYKPNGILVSGILEQFKIWTKKAGIQITPTIFINGKKIPELYNWNDFVAVVEYNIQDQNNVCANMGFKNLYPNK